MPTPRSNHDQAIASVILSVIYRNPRTRLSESAKSLGIKWKGPLKSWGNLLKSCGNLFSSARGKMLQGNVNSRATIGKTVLLMVFFAATVPRGAEDLGLPGRTNRAPGAEETTSRSRSGP